MTTPHKSIADADALLIYRVGPVYCCSPTFTVESVIMPPSLTHTPGVNEAQPGVFKYSSGLVRVVDLRKRFGVDKEQWQKPGRIVIAEVMGGHAGFWVDEIVDVVQMPMTGWNNLPAQLPQDVFSKTLLMNEVIHLYAEFERLDAFKETGYLRQHIEMLLAQAAQKQQSLTTNDRAGGVSGKHSGPGTSASSVATMRDSHPKKQAAQLDSGDIRQVTASAQPAAVSETRAVIKSHAGQADQKPAKESPSISERKLSRPSQGQYSTRTAAADDVRSTSASSPAGVGSVKDETVASDPGSASSVSQTVPQDIKKTSGNRTHGQASESLSHRQRHANFSRVSQRQDNTVSHSSVPSSMISDRYGGVQSAQDVQSRRGGIYLLLLLLIALAWYGITEHQQTPVSNTNEIPVKIPLMSESPVEFEPAEIVESSQPVHSEDVSQADETPVLEQLDDSAQLSEGGEPVVAEMIEYRADIERDDEGIVIVLSQSATTTPRPESTPTMDDIDDVLTNAEIATEAETKVEIETAAPGTDNKEQQPDVDPVEVGAVEVSPLETVRVLVEEASPALAEPDVESVDKEKAPGSTQVIVHIVVKGDTLWHIARRYVKNPYLYPELARLSKIKNPDLIYPGDRVKIILTN